MKKILKCISAMVFSCVTVSSVMGSEEPIPIASKEMQQLNPGIYEAYKRTLGDEVRDKVWPPAPFGAYKLGIFVENQEERMLRASFHVLWEYIMYAMAPSDVRRQIPLFGLPENITYDSQATRLERLAWAAQQMKDSPNITIRYLDTISQIKSYNDVMRVMSTEIPRDKWPAFLKNKKLDFSCNVTNDLVYEICEFLKYGVVQTLVIQCDISAEGLMQIIRACDGIAIDELVVSVSSPLGPIEGFSAIPNVTKLSLSNVSLSARGCREIGRIASSHDHLRILNLPNVEYNRGSYNLFQGIKRGQVEVLSVDEIDDKCLKLLAVHCPGTTKVISFNKWGSSEVESHIQGIRILIVSTPSLETLRFPLLRSSEGLKLLMRQNCAFDIALSNVKNIEFLGDERPFASITAEQDQDARIKAAIRLCYPNAKLDGEEQAQSASSSSSSDVATASVKEEEKVQKK